MMAYIHKHTKPCLWDRGIVAMRWLQIRGDMELNRAANEETQQTLVLVEELR